MQVLETELRPPGLTVSTFTNEPSQQHLQIDLRYSMWQIKLTFSWKQFIILDKIWQATLVNMVYRNQNFKKWYMDLILHIFFILVSSQVVAHMISSYTRATQDWFLAIL